MSKKHKMDGILMGITVCRDHGHAFITMSIGGKEVSMSPDQAGFLFAQLGDHLDVLGYFDDEEEDMEGGHVTH